MEKQAKLSRHFSIAGIACLVCISVFFVGWKASENHSETIEYKGQQFEVFTIQTVDKIVFGYKDSSNKQLRNFKRFKAFELTKGNEVYFAVNGGMFTKRFEPQGLYIQDKMEIQPVDLDSGYGNFYLLPNGVFGLNAGKPFILETKTLMTSGFVTSISFATQSGPMLVVADSIHPAFNEGSKNKHIRNGVGINKKGEVVFVISNQKTNFYDFALLFRDELNCSNALYLDGAISKMYNEETNRMEDGSFGVMIGVIK